MISKNEVKYIQSLSDKKNRDHHGVFVAEGPKVVQELLDNGMTAQMVYTTKKAGDRENKKPNIFEVNPGELQRISRFDTANETVGVFYKPALPPLRLAGTFTLVLDGIQDPGNMGTLIRTADWFGVSQIIASHDSADCFNSKVVQSTMGSVARVSVYYENIEDVLRKVSNRIVGARLNGTRLSDVPKLKEGILIIGNESKGIRNNVSPYITESVTIPRTGSAESLNAAVAAGILLSHLLLD